jgi:hypothetical protein
MFFALTSSAIALDTNVSYEEARTALFKREGVTKIDDITLATADHFKQRAIAEMKQYPIGLLKALGTALAAFFTHDAYVGILDHYGISLNYTHPGLSTLITDPVAALSFVANMATRPEILVIVGRLFWILTTLAAIAGGILYLIRHGLSVYFVFFAGAIVYFAFTSLVLGLAVTGRFRIPVNPFIFMFAVYAVQWLYARYWNTRNLTPLLSEPAQRILLEK